MKMLFQLLILLPVLITALRSIEDFSKLSITKLKSILYQKKVECKGCLEKADFVRAAYENRHILDESEKKNEDEPLEITPLMTAILTGDTAKAVRLIKSGANLEAEYANGNTALSYAAYHNNSVVTRELLRKGARINHQTLEGSTPLMFAAWRGYTEIASMLIEHGADVNLLNADGRNALFVAAAFNHFQIVLNLLSTKKVNLWVKDKNSDTVLHYTTRMNSDKSFHHYSNIIWILMKEMGVVYCCNSGLDNFLGMKLVITNITFFIITTISVLIISQIILKLLSSSSKSKFIVDGVAARDIIHYRELLQKREASLRNQIKNDSNNVQESQELNKTLCVDDRKEKINNLISFSHLFGKIFISVGIPLTALFLYHLMLHIFLSKPV
jgi:hypothetical protein